MFRSANEDAGPLRSRRFVLPAALVLAGALAACSAPGAPNEAAPGGGGDPQAGGTLAIGIESETDVLDPQRAGGWVSYRVNRQMYEPLVDEDLSEAPEGNEVPELRPGLAESWEVSEDGLTYTFQIREGVTFHDGSALDAAAVEFNIRRMWDEDFEFYDTQAAGQTNFVWQYLESISLPDPMTVQLTMSQPFSPFLRLLSQGGNGSTAIISPTAIREHGNDDVAEHPSGTGPFRFVERVRGQRITLERNEDYWGDVPLLERVIFRPLPDASTRVSALRGGEVDMIAVPSPDSVQSLEDADFNVVQSSPPHVWYLSFNMDDPIMSDVRVRRAVNHAINREGLATDLLRGTVEPAVDVLPRANEAFEPQEEAYTYDPELAQELLAEAGHADGFTTEFWTSVDGSGQIVPVPMAEYIQQDLARVGITAELDTTEWISYLTKWAGGLTPGAGMAQQSWGMTTPFWLYIVTSPTLQAPNGPNVGRYDSPELEALMQQAITATDEQTANQFWRQAADKVTEDAALAPIINDTAPYVLSPEVQGFVAPNEEWYDLTTVWMG